MHKTKENKNVYLLQYFHYVLNLILKNHKKTQKKKKYPQISIDRKIILSVGITKKSFVNQTKTLFLML